MNEAPPGLVGPKARGRPAGQSAGLRPASPKGSPDGLFARAALALTATAPLSFPGKRVAVAMRRCLCKVYNAVLIPVRCESAQESHECSLSSRSLTSLPALRAPRSATPRPLELARTADLARAGPGVLSSLLLDRQLSTRSRSARPPVRPEVSHG